MNEAVEVGNHTQKLFGVPLISRRNAKSRVSEVTVHGSAKTFAQEITNGRHRLIADEPIPAGGADTGPYPHELLIAALGACTSMTIALYGRRKGWALDSVTVKVRHAKVEGADGAPIERIECEITLIGCLSNLQRARLLDVANKCPVHQTLASKLDIASKLVVQGRGSCQ